MLIETIKVKDANDPDGYRVINKSDFDPKRDVAFEASEKPKPRRSKTKSET